MRRLWVRWALLVAFVAVLGTVFVNLGDWQLRRLEERRARNATVISNEQRPVRPFTEVFNHPLRSTDEWQRVEARGTFDGDHQFVVRHRSSGDVSGYSVVTPLRTTAGTLLVNRGLIRLQKSTEIPTTGPPPPAGQVTVVGHVRTNEQGRRGAVQPSAGSVRYINSDALASALPYPVLNGYLGALRMDPPDTGFQPVSVPELSEGPHFWYAMQWFLFCALAVLGIVVFIRGDLRERRLGKPEPGQRTRATRDRPDAKVTSSV